MNSRHAQVASAFSQCPATAHGGVLSTFVEDGIIVGTGFADIDQLLTDLGGDPNVIGFYDRRKGKTIATGVSEWADVRATGGGPTWTNATGAQQPTEGASGELVFDGVDDRLIALGGRTPEVTNDVAFSVVLNSGSGGASRTLIEAFVNAGTLNILSSWQDAPPGSKYMVTAGRSFPQITGDALVAPATIVVVHARRSTVTGGGTNVTAFSRLGAGVEWNGAGNPGGDDVADRLILGCNRILGSFTDAKVRAVLIYKSADYPGSQNKINSWAVANHGAVI